MPVFLLLHRVTRRKPKLESLAVQEALTVASEITPKDKAVMYFQSYLASEIIWMGSSWVAVGISQLMDEILQAAHRASLS